MSPYVSVSNIIKKKLVFSLSENHLENSSYIDSPYKYLANT